MVRDLPSAPESARRPVRIARTGCLALALLAALCSLPAYCDIVFNQPLEASQPICVDGIASSAEYPNVAPLGFHQGSLHQIEPALADSTARLVVGEDEDMGFRRELALVFTTTVTGLRPLANGEPLFACDLDVLYRGVPTPARLWVMGTRRAGVLQYLFDRGRDGSIDSTVGQADIEMAAGGGSELVVEIGIALAGRKATAAPASRVNAFVFFPDPAHPGSLLQRQITESDYTLGTDAGVLANNQAVTYQVQTDLDYNNAGNKINLSQNGVVRVVVFSTGTFNAPASVNAGTVRLGDPRLVAIGRIPVPPARSQVHDQNGDGLQDLILFFDAQSLVGNGVLDVNSTELDLTASSNDPNPGDGIVDVDPLFAANPVQVSP